MKYALHATGATEPTGPYSQATTAGRLIYVSGQVAVDDTHVLVSDDIAVQTEAIIKQFEVVLAAAQCTLEDIAQVTIYVSDLSNMDVVDSVWRRYFIAPAPARSVVQVDALPFGAKIEMDCVACR